MTLARRTIALRAIAIVGVLAAISGVVISAAIDSSQATDVIAILATVAIGSLVWLLAPVEPRNPLTWVLASVVLAIGLYALGLGLTSLLWPGVTIPADFEASIPEDLPLGFLLIYGLTQSLALTAVIALLTFGLLLFPDGRLPSRRWRWLGYFCAIGLVYLFVTGVSPNLLRDSGSLADIWFLFLLSPLPCLASLFFRFRAAEAETRSQIKWILWGALVMVPTLLISTSGGPELLSTVGFTAFAASYGVAILKYRLYDIDIVISRTVVLALLAGFITLTYAIVVVGIGGLIGGDSDEILFPILATAIVALAFEPVRNKAQGWANRLVYGQRATPYEVLSDLTGRLSHGEEGEGLLGRMAKRLGDGTGAERATIWLGSPGEMAVGASWPIDAEPGHRIDFDADNVFSVTHDGVGVGAFEVIKPRGSILSSAERSLINDLAGSAGAVLGYQRLNDSLTEKAAELAQSRARLVDAQDSERRRLERDLHDGAQQLIVALKVKIGLARAMAAKHGAADVEDLLRGLGEEAQSALDEVRALAKGIYPPVLESDGLGSAVSALASGAPEDVVLSCEGLGRYERDIEAAIYFEISEAVTNAIKHASGPIRVDLVGLEHEVRFSVTDSGPGFDVTSANGGSGLQNLRDRIDAVGGSLAIESSVGSPTAIRGSVPLQPALV